MFDDELELQRRNKLQLIDVDSAHLEFAPSLLDGDEMHEIIKEVLSSEKDKLFR